MNQKMNPKIINLLILVEIINLNKAITNIREHDGLISFDFMKNEETDIDATSNADSNTANKYFSINGTMMNGTPTKKGIYIMRTSKGETKKIIK